MWSYKSIKLKTIHAIKQSLNWVKIFQFCFFCGWFLLIILNNNAQNYKLFFFVCKQKKLSFFLLLQKSIIYYNFNFPGERLEEPHNKYKNVPSLRRSPLLQIVQQLHTIYICAYIPYKYICMFCIIYIFFWGLLCIWQLPQTKVFVLKILFHISLSGQLIHGVSICQYINISYIQIISLIYFLLFFLRSLAHSVDNKNQTINAES